MRKALILTVLALFGSEALAQKSFRHAPTVALDDLQDNEMRLDLSPYPAGMNDRIQQAIRQSERIINNDYRVKVGRWDDSQDNEMSLQDAVHTALKHYGNAHRLGFDEAEDNEMFTRPMKRFEKFDDVEDNNLASWSVGNSGKSASLNVGSGASNARVRLDDFQDDFLLDQYEVFMLLGDGRDQYQQSIWPVGYNPKPSDTFASENPSFLGSGKSGVLVQGGNAPQGGVFSTGSAQMTGTIGNTGANWIVGATGTYSPGAPMSITPHVGISKSF